MEGDTPGLSELRGLGGFSMPALVGWLSGTASLDSPRKPRHPQKPRPPMEGREV